MKRRPIPTLRLPFDGSLNLPGSKSEANRAIVAAALCRGKTTIRNATPCDDVRYLVGGLQAMGYRVAWITEDCLEVEGGIPAQPSETSAREIFCGNAGTAIRFLCSVAVVTPGKWEIVGDQHMAKRPISDLVQAWSSFGVAIKAPTACPPVQIEGGLTKGGSLKLDASKSSQYLSSLLLVASGLRGGLRIELASELASAGYVELTKQVLGRFGVDVKSTGPSSSSSTVIEVKETQSISPGNFDVEGDWSAAGCFYCLAELANSVFRPGNLRDDSLQSDRALLQHLADLRARGDLEINVSETPDQLMNLALVAGRRSAKTRFVGAANLRIKECDRLAITARELRGIGLKVEIEEDGLLLEPTRQVVGADINPEADHRLAMMGAIFGSLVPGVQIRDPQCVSKSYPQFFDDLNQLGNQTRPLVLVGMRAAGKSSLGRQLALVLGLEFIDSDSLFENEFGDISQFVEQYGWPDFRHAEAKIIADSLRPGVLIAAGGGAIENPGTRKLLRDKALVVWIDEEWETIQMRLRTNDQGRPALTDAGLLNEVKSTLDHRVPFYKETADIILPPGLSMQAQSRRLIEELERSCAW